MQTFGHMWTPVSVDFSRYWQLARQAAQPSCQLRWCGGGALGKQAVTCQPDCSGARVRCGAARPFVADCRFAPAAKPFQPVRPLRLVRWLVPAPFQAGRPPLDVNEVLET